LSNLPEKMIIFLYGPDSYRRLQKQLELQESYREKKGNLSKEYFDMEEEGAVEMFKDFMANRSMFGDAKFAVVENAYEATDNKQFRETLKNELESKTAVVLINTEGKPPATLKFLLEKPVKSQSFEALKGTVLEHFINKEAVRRGLKLSASIVESLQEMFQSDTWGIITELDKMMLTGNHIESRGIKKEFYPLVNILRGDRDFKKRLVALEIILSDRRDDPARVFNVTSYGPRNQKEAAVFADYDVSVKSGKLDYEEVLVDFALS